MPERRYEWGFHGTSPGNAISIAKGGFKPGRNGRVFFTENFEEARKFGACWGCSDEEPMYAVVRARMSPRIIVERTRHMTQTSFEIPAKDVGLILVKEISFFTGKEKDGRVVFD